MRLAPFETADYITIYCPELLELLSPVIFGVLLGFMATKEAVEFIKTNVLKEDE